MYKKLLVIMGMLAAISAFAQTNSLTLEQYIHHVVQHNKDLKLAEKDRELAGVQKKQATASALPTIGMEGNYNRNLTDYFMYFDMSALNPEATGFAKAPIKFDNEFGLNVALQQTLFSPNVGSAIKAARQYTHLTDKIYNATQQAVVSGAKKLYHQCLLLEKVHAVSRGAEQNAKDNFDQMQLKFNNGQVSKFELLQAETRWRSTVPETQKAERNLKLAMNTLKHMGGLNADEVVTLSGSLTDVPALPMQVELNDVLAARPDFKAMHWEEKLRETNVGAAKGAYLPTLTGTLAWAYSAQSDQFEMDQENKLWLAGVKLSVPIFTGGYRPAMVQKAKVELGKTRLNIEKAREKIDNEVSNIQLRLHEASQRIVSAESTLKVAEQGFQIAETTAQNGLATQLQLKDARMGFDQATLNYYAAVYDYLDAYFDWELATGKVTAD